LTAHTFDESVLFIFLNLTAAGKEEPVLKEDKIDSISVDHFAFITRK